MSKNRCPTFKRHIRRQAGSRQIFRNRNRFSSSGNSIFFVWVSNSHLMLGCSSWRLDMNLNWISRYQFGKKTQYKIDLGSSCLLQVNVSVKRSSLKLSGYFSRNANAPLPASSYTTIFLAGVWLWTSWPSPAPNPSSLREVNEPGHAPLRQPCARIVNDEMQKAFPHYTLSPAPSFSLLIRRKISQLCRRVIKSCN